MRYDFSTVEDKDSFVSVPEGVHACKVAEIRPGHARDGSERWRLRLEVLDGEWAGRTAAWDSLTWSDRGVHRVKVVLQALGIDASGEVELEPADLMGLRAQVQVEVEEWEDPVSGRRQLRNHVPYLGFAALENGAAGAPGFLDNGGHSAGVDHGGGEREPAGDGCRDPDVPF